MKGQWIGTYSGSVEGTLMVNVDEFVDRYEAVAYIRPNDRNIPASVAYLKTENKNDKQETKAFINSVDPRTGYQCKWEDIALVNSLNMMFPSIDGVCEELKERNFEE